MKTVYKVLSRTEDGKLTSICDYTKRAQIYTPGEWKICPNMFVFGSFEEALDYGVEEIWECETPETRPAPKYILFPSAFTLKRKYSLFWAEPERYAEENEDIWESPQGSLNCDQLRMIRRIA